MLPSDVPIYVATETIDMRWSFDILAGVVRERLGEEPRNGALFVFFGRRFDRMKILFFDQTGYCLLYKRLDRGTFHVPSAAAGQRGVVVDEEELALLLEGLDLPERARNKRRAMH
jgi:transposase